MKKKYIITGVVEFSMQTKGKLIRFENGSVSGLGTVPASYTTDNKEIQDTIEGTSMFKSGQIKIAEVYGGPVPAANVTAVESVANIQDARKYFQERGYELKDLASKADVLNVAKELNVVFPNWNK